MNKINLIQKLYSDGKTQKEIGERLGYTQPWISILMKKNRINTRKSLLWKKEEEAIVKKYYPNKEKLKTLLKNRTWKAIKDKASKIGVSVPKEIRDKSDKRKKFLKKLSNQKLIKIDFDKKKTISYIIGVLDGDGFTGKNQIGLETKYEKFVDKFISNLKEIGFNPGKGSRIRQYGKMYQVWASSKTFVEWYKGLSFKDKNDYFKENNMIWEFIEGIYDSDGSVHPCGSPCICSCSEKRKRFLKKLLKRVKVDTSIHQLLLWVKKRDAKRFFNHVNSVYKHKNREK